MAMASNLYFSAHPFTAHTPYYSSVTHCNIPVILDNQHAIDICQFLWCM